MISIDVYIIEFVSGNWIALSLLLGALKIIAEMTDWVTDDKIYTLLAGTFHLVRKPSQGEIRADEERGVRLEQ